MSVERFIQYITAEKRYSDHTASAYRKDVERFVEFTCSQGGLKPGDFDPVTVTSDDIRNWIMELAAQKLSASSVNRMTSSLRAYFRWLRKMGEVEKDPFLRVGFQKKSSRLPVYLPEKQMGEIMAEIESKVEPHDIIASRNYLIVLIFYSTGLRLSELREIRVSDFSNGFRELKVLGKGNKQRIVPIVEYTAEKIKSYIRKIRESLICESGDFYLFLTKKGEAVSRTGIYDIVRSQLAAAGVQGKKSPHVLRHTFATHMLNDGADIKEIQELLGHSSLNATQIYTHNSISKLKEVYKAAHPRQKKSE